MMHGQNNIKLKHQNTMHRLFIYTSNNGVDAG